ncbi:MAG: hypothetical protein C5B54_01150 [Acidobacteria bacterium]|nr:MAG: hypothetical protein C5B54_01150 [Acidobacteriota bacterium]
MLITIWLVILFLGSFLAYLGFSFVAQDAVSLLSQSLDPTKRDYDLPPLSRLYPNPERLEAILNFSRLLFVMPILLLAYYWTAPFGAKAFAPTLGFLMLLLYLLPEWTLTRAPDTLFRGTVQVTVYLFYWFYWFLAKLAPLSQKQEETQPEEKRTKGNGEAETAETAGFKVDLLKAISVIGETTVREVMTPRVDMVTIAATATLDELHQMFKEHKFSRVPVYKEKVDNIAGIVSVMDLVSAFPKADLSAPVSSLMRPAAFVPETKKVFTLLLEFREAHTQMAIVIDEYGGTSGLVTLEDLLEEIVGEIQDEYDEAPSEAHREKEGSYVVTGKFPVERLEELFDLQVPSEDFETISGLIFSILGRIPLVGEMIRYQNLNLEILEADKRRIHRVRIRMLPKETETTMEAADEHR